MRRLTRSIGTGSFQGRMGSLEYLRTDGRDDAAPRCPLKPKLVGRFVPAITRCFRRLSRSRRDVASAARPRGGHLFYESQSLPFHRIPLRSSQTAHMARPRVVDHDERELLERLFAWAPAHATDRRRRTRSAQAAVRASHTTPLPRGVFKLVLSFWESERDWWLYQCNSSRFGCSECSVH